MKAQIVPEGVKQHLSTAVDKAQHCLSLDNLTERYQYGLVVQVGENGAGKTTLLKILLGELEPVSGYRHAHRSLRIGYFTQHHVDQLQMNQTAVELLATRFPG